MIRRTRFVSSKLLSVLLAVAMIVGMVPMSAISAVATDHALGTVEALVSGGTVEGNSIIFSGAQLEWSPADSSIGRWTDGWWVGVKVTAPADVNMEKAGYQNMTSTGWGEVKSFKQYRDSNDASDTQYITLWGVVNEGFVLNALVNGKEYLNYEYQFDWDGDGQYEQPVAFRVDPKNIVLNKSGVQVYPKASGLAQVDLITAGVAVEKNGGNMVLVQNTSEVTLNWSAKNPAIGRHEDGWWIGYNVVAPADANIEKATYQHKTASGWNTAQSFNSNKDTANSIQVWRLVNEAYLNNALANHKTVNYDTRYDWDGDGVYEQVISLKIDPKKVVLLAENGEQVYPYLGTVTPLTGGAVSGNTGNLELKIEETVLNWSPANPEIGRNSDGWWVGMNVEAPKDATGEQLKNATYKRRFTASGGTAWSEYSSPLSFWSNKDSKDNAAAHYISVWMVLTPALLTNYQKNGTMVRGEYIFDWDGDGKDDQIITMTVVPSDKIVLTKVQQTGFGFADSTPADQWVGATYQNVATGGQGTGAVTYAITSGSDVATIDAATGAVTFSAEGVVVVTATKAADDTYAEATAKYTVKGIKLPQTDFKFANSNATIIKEFAEGSYQNVASGGESTGAVTYEITAGSDVATIDADGTVTFIKAGTVTVVAHKAADSLYNEATVTYTLTIEKSAQQALEFVEAPTAITYNPAAQSVFTVVGGSGEGAVTYSIIAGDEYASIDSVSGVITTLKAGGTFTVQVDKAGDDGYLAAEPITATVTVEHAQQTGFAFEQEAPEAITYNDNNNVYSNVAAGGESTGAVTYDFADAASATIAQINHETGELTISAAGTISVVATRAGDDCYLPAQAVYTLVVQKDVPEFNVSNVELVYGVPSHQISVETILGSADYVYSIVGDNAIGALLDENGLITFENSDAKVGSITIQVLRQEDACYVELAKTFALNVAYHQTDAQPTVSGDTKNASGWYVGNVKIHAPEGYAISYRNDRIGTEWSDSVDLVPATDGVHTPTVYLKKGDEITAGIVMNEIALDTSAPVDLAITYEKPFAEKVLEAITFGFFKKDKISVTLTATDVTSDVAYIVYSVDGVNDVRVDAEDFDSNENGAISYTFEIDAQFRNKVTFAATNVAGLTADSESHHTLVLDTVSPQVSVSYEAKGDNALMQEIDGTIYYNSDVTATITIKETNFFEGVVENAGQENESVVHNVGVKLTVTDNDGVQTVYEYLPAGSAQVYNDATPIYFVWSHDGDEHSFSIDYAEDADYQLEMVYTDYAANQAVFTDNVGGAEELLSYQSKVITVDKTAPIVSVEYSDSVINTINGRKYYDAQQSVKITVTEHNFRASDFVAEVVAQDVTGAAVVVENFAATLANQNNWTQEGNTYTITLNYTVDANYTFDYEYEDLAQNKAQAYDGDAFTVDTTAPEQLTITYKGPKVGDKILEAISFGFYDAPVSIEITAQDNTSGIHKFMYSYLNAEGVSKVNKELADQVIEAADILQEGNLFTATFTVPQEVAAAIQQFNGNVEFVAYDCANNTAQLKDNRRVVVDNIAPEITVEYQADAETTLLQSVGNNDYYNGNVTTTITIDEANFFEGANETVGEETVVVHNVGIKLTVTDNNGVSTTYEYLPAGAAQLYPELVPVYVTWTHNGDKHAFKIPYNQDADYVLEIEYMDFSKNEAKSYTSQVVTVDKIAPVVKVEYSNKNVIHTIGGRKYYDAKQSAKITVTEHNFRASDFVAEVEALNAAGAAVKVENFAATLANQKNWTKNGNVYTITLNYAVDANYTFDYSYLDLAQNKAKEYKEDAFTVDTKAPKNLKISYSTSVLDKILESVTFGYYDAQVTVSISAQDDTAGVYYFVYSYLKSEGVSDVNVQLLNDKIKEASINHEEGTNVYTTSFTVPKKFIPQNTQFNGTVEFTAYDRAENNTELVDDQRVIVDDITPKATITYNKPVQEANGISYYAGNIDATIVINEANFYNEDVTVLVNGKAVSVNWVDNSVDVHTGTFTLTEDGDYVVTVEYTDRSGNEMTSYTSNQLTLDTKAPTVNATNIKHQSANKDEKYGFTITANDINLDGASFVPELTAVVRLDNGKYTTKNVSLGDKKTVKAGDTYTFTVDNLADDALYTLVCTVRDMAGNSYSKIMLKDGKSYDQVQFSINRDGSTFTVDSFTKDLVDQYYVFSVTEDVVIEEINVDPIEEYVVKLNGEELVEGTDYTSDLSNKAGQWSKRTYTISKDLFKGEGEYSLIVESVDKTNTTAYSDVKNLNVSFVVDQTPPVLTISGLENDGRYQVNEQTVTVIPTDDGGRLYSIKVLVLNSDGNAMTDAAGKDISVRFELAGDELLTYLAENNGQISFTVPEGLENQVKILCNDCALSAEDKTNEQVALFTSVTVSQSSWIIFYANKPLFYGAIAGVVLLIGGVIFLIAYKKRKKEAGKKENDQ